MLTSRPLDNASGDASMTRRRLRLPELIALLAVAAPVVAAQPDPAAGTPSVADSARQLGASVKHSSAELSQRVATGAREAGEKLSAGMQQAGQSMHRWWDGVRGNGSHSQGHGPPNSVAQGATLQNTSLKSSSSHGGSLQTTSSLMGSTHSAKSQGTIAATGQSWP